MSVSIDKSPAEGSEQARAVLAGSLADYGEGRCAIDEVQQSFLSVCRNDPDASWDALALLDQYARRGRIEPSLAQSLKADIEKLVFGSAGRVRYERRDAAASASSLTRKESPAREGPGADDTVTTAERPVTPSVPDQTMDLSNDSARARPTRADPGPGPGPDPGSGPDPDPGPGPGLSIRDEVITAQRGRLAAAPDERGSRWCALTAQRDAAAIRRDPVFVEHTRFERRPEPHLAEPERERRPPPAPHRASSSAPSASSRLAAHRILRGRYELLAELGRGVTGVVYRAIDRQRTHLSESARRVAVKVLSANFRAAPAALAALEREFHQAQSLAHPNIVRVFDLDRDGDTHFIVMELLEGRLLSEMFETLGGRRMKREYAFGVIASVGAALAHAHRRAVVHADLKPSNVMITTSGEVRVLDFGFARNRALELHTASASHETQAPSPAYASVERVNGSEPDASDDVYSLACVAYELLCGKHPFGGRSALLARSRGRRPSQVRGLTHKQAYALKRALLWTRGERRIDVAELMNALGCAEAPQAVATPAKIVAADARGLRWLRGAAWAAGVAAIVAAVIYFMPRIMLRGPIQPPTAAPITPTAEERDPAPALTNAKSAEASPPAAPIAQPNASLAAAAAPVRASAPTLQFDKDTYVANESDAFVQLTVKRTGSASRPVMFRWSLRGNSAEAGADFAAIGPGTEEIPAGAREAHINIPLVSDAIVENTELFLVELQGVQEGASLGDRAHAAVIIVDDD